jgi:hypothetical protein
LPGVVCGYTLRVTSQAQCLFNKRILPKYGLDD